MTENDARDLADRIMQEEPRLSPHMEKLSRPEAKDLHDYVVQVVDPWTGNETLLESPQEWENYIQDHPVRTR